MVYFKNNCFKGFSGRTRILLGILLISVAGFAQPQYFNNTYVGGANSIPFSPNSSTTFQRAQFVWGPGAFTGATAGAINKVYFYAASTTTSTFTSFVVKLGTSATNPLSSTAWFTTGMVTALSSSSYTITTTTSGWAAITLTTPVAYDPTKFLIIDISSTGTTAGGFTINQQTLTMVPGRVWGTATAGTPSSQDNLTPDFGFDLLKSANDVGITSLVSPISPCGTTQDPVIMRISNLGSNVIAANQNISIGATLNGVTSATLSKKFNRSIAIGASDTVHLGYISNTNAMNGNLITKAWCRFTADTAFKNDTLRNTLFISGTPGPPNPKDVTRCGGGSARLNAGVPSNGVGVWYNSNTSITALGIDSIFNTPFLYPGSYTFYVESGRLSGTNFITTGLSNVGTNFGAGNPGGNMFNITANKSLKVDSIALNLNTTNVVTVNVYAKAGTYSGFQGSPAAWTLIKTQKVTGKGIGKETRVNLSGFVVPVGLYGIYVQVSDGMVYNSGAGSFTNNDMTIASGDAIQNSFGTVTTNGSWSGNIYYRTVCTGTRLPVGVVVKPSPYGATLVKGTPFQTTQPATIGTTGNPDIVAKGDVLTYELTPPTGFSNANHGSKWFISNLVFKTKSGRVLTTKYYSPGTPAPVGANNAKITFSPDSTLTDSTIIMTVSVNDLGPNFCDSTLTRTIFVAPRPVPDFKFTNSVCDGDNVVFTNVSKISSGTLTYKWDFNTGNPADTSQNQDVVFTFPSHGIFNVKLYATSVPYGYVTVKTIPVEVIEIPKIGYKVFNACMGDSVSFVNTTTISAGKITYKWDFGNGKTSVKVSPKHLYADAGGYKVTLTATSNGCSSTLSKTAQEFARPVAKFTIPTVTCDKSDVQFANNSTIVRGNMGYTWDFGDGGTSTIANPVHVFNSTGVKPVKLRVLSEFGCADSITKSVVLLTSPVADFETGPTCSQSNTNFNFTGSKPGGGVTTVFNWNFAGEGSSTVESPSKLFSNVGKKLITLTLTSNNGCTDMISKEINIKLQSKADFNTSDMCEGENAVFANLSTVAAGNLLYNWRFGDGAISSSQSPRHLYNIAGISKTFNVTLVAVVPGGCSDSITKPVSVNANPIADFSYKTSGRLVYFTANTTTATAYHWSFGDGSSAETANSQYNYMLYPSGKYEACLTVTNAAGCNTQVCKTISISGGVEQLEKMKGVKVYPNPNNGLFVVAIEDPASDLSIEIYNSIGELVKTVKGNSLTTNYPIELTTAGLYTLKINNDGEIGNHKITVSK
jgi:PKD repeat protein